MIIIFFVPSRISFIFLKSYINSCTVKSLLIPSFRITEPILTSAKRNTWVISAPVELSIVCFRYLPDPDLLDEAVLDDLQYRILSELEKSGKAFLTPAVLGGHTCLRACFANHRTSPSDVALLFEVLNTVAGRIFKSLKR